jgi:hypothetical protein
MYDKEAISLTERLKQTGILQTDRFITLSYTSYLGKKMPIV